MTDKRVAIIGGGPAGLMAAELLSARGLCVDVYDRKPSPARKFLMAGRGGLNLTHSENIDDFISRYGVHASVLAPVIRAFPPQVLRAWCDGLGEATFVGSSGRVFPESFKASPLLRAWLTRLEDQGVTFHVNHNWRGWHEKQLLFETPDGLLRVKPEATLLALGGASWPRLGSDGSWVDILKKSGVEIAPLLPANCGFLVQWSAIFREKFSGHPLKAIVASSGHMRAAGEIIITAQGVEGGAIYALSKNLREGTGELMIDLKPDLDMAVLSKRLNKNRGRESLSNHLRKAAGLPPVAIGLLMERPDRAQMGQYSAEYMAQLIKNYPLKLQGPCGMDRAISTAGGISFAALDSNAMLRALPGVFAAGEMLDWEAPTGGYLLQASFATGVYAARGIMAWLDGGVNAADAIRL